MTVLKYGLGPLTDIVTIRKKRFLGTGNHVLLLVYKGSMQNTLDKRIIMQYYIYVHCSKKITIKEVIVWK